ncbi:MULTISPECIES: carboxymuconolactone decarboxylase family protein [Streptomyces]|uniref:carboxymuconolactone decarboxylase family protein n=1 Tax=Streptomyces lycopersici TaxID=2974589 RepID=UPI00293ED722|nr:carboxymuconolactone decarboxylase family protein [Streptomyces sp. NEAU-383]
MSWPDATDLPSVPPCTRSPGGDARGLRAGAPVAFKAFQAFGRAAFSDSEKVIPRKYTELMAVAVALATQCPHCIEAHTKATPTGAPGTGGATRPGRPHPEGRASVVLHLRRHAHHAGEDQQTTRRAELLGACVVQGEVAGAQQQSQHGQIHRWCHQRCRPRRHAQPQSESPYVSEPEKERQRGHRCHDQGDHAKGVLPFD